MMAVVEIEAAASVITAAAAVVLTTAKPRPCSALADVFAAESAPTFVHRGPAEHIQLAAVQWI